MKNIKNIIKKYNLLNNGCLDINRMVELEKDLEAATDLTNEEQKDLETITKFLNE